MKKKILWSVGIALIGVVLVLILLVIPLLTSIPDTPNLPVPNGYEEFVKAGEMRRGDFSRYKEMSQEELQKLLNDDQEALQLVKLGLSRESRVPITYSEVAMEPHMKELAGIKSVAFMLTAEGRLAELSDRPGEALRHYLDVVRLGQASRQGGLLIDLLVGVACEAIGLNALTGLVPSLDLSQCRELVQKLEAIDGQQPPEKTLLEPERLWARKTFGLRWVIIRLVRPAMLKEQMQKALAKVRRLDAQRRRLILEGAVRAYELEKGNRPSALTDLLPDFLGRLPLDPETARPMDYPL